MDSDKVADTLTDLRDEAQRQRAGLITIRDIVNDLVEAGCPDAHADCPCYQDGLQEGRESERQPVGA